MKSKSKRNATKDKVVQYPPVAYTPNEFALASRFGRTKLFELFKNGEGPKSFRVGRRVLITVEAAQEWVRALEQQNAKAGA